MRLADSAPCNLLTLQYFNQRTLQLPGDYSASVGMVLLHHPGFIQRVAHKDLSRHQHRRTKNPSTVAKCRTEQRSVESVIEEMLLDRGTRLKRVQQVKITHAASDHDCIGIKDINYRSESLGELFPQPL